MIVLLLLALCMSCGRDESDDQIVVLAAASLTEAFTEMAAEFEAMHPGLEVQLSLAGSAALREQILEGVPADVFASANESTMQTLIEANEVQDPTTFATNELLLAVPAANPGGVASAQDLANDDLFVGLCAVGVPCGDFARDALEQIDVVPSIDTNERDVRSLVTKLSAGELDAGIVYATDVQATPEVMGIALPPAVDVSIRYPIASLVDAANPGDASAFIAFVQSSDGQAILTSHGFGAP